MTVRRVALITGCGKTTGIGAAIARVLASTGVAVVVSDVEKAGVPDPGEVRVEDDGWQGLESLVADIQASGGKAAWVRGDVTSEADARRMVDETVASHGRLDILVNNAGSPFGADRVDIEEVQLDVWEKVVAINMRGPFLMSRAAVAPMRRERWGRIITISSSGGLFGAPRTTSYAASKAGVMGFTRALAMDVAPWNITANCICPGSTFTSRSLSGLRKAGYGDDLEKGKAEKSRNIPLGRYGTPEEIGGTVAYLCSDAAAFMTGQALLLDGGKGGGGKVQRPESD